MFWSTRSWRGELDMAQLNFCKVDWWLIGISMILFIGQLYYYYYYYLFQFRSGLWRHTSHNYTLKTTAYQLIRVAVWIQTSTHNDPEDKYINITTWHAKLSSFHETELTKWNSKQWNLQHLSALCWTPSLNSPLVCFRNVTRVYVHDTK